MPRSFSRCASAISPLVQEPRRRREDDKEEGSSLGEGDLRPEGGVGARPWLRRAHGRLASRRRHARAHRRRHSQARERRNNIQCPSCAVEGSGRQGCDGPAHGEGGGAQSSPAILTPATKNDVGRATAQPQAVPIPGSQRAGAAVSPNAPQKPSAGRDSEPPTPQAEDARTSSAAVSTCAEALPHARISRS